jgi:hypothetical protein
MEILFKLAGTLAAFQAGGTETLVREAISQGGAILIACFLVMALKEVVRRWQSDNDSARIRETSAHVREVETRDRLLIQIQSANDKLLESQKELSSSLTSLCDEIGNLRTDLERRGIKRPA